MPVVCKMLRDNIMWLTCAAACGINVATSSHSPGEPMRRLGSCRALTSGRSPDRPCGHVQESSMANPLAQHDRSGAAADRSSLRDPLSIPAEVKASIRVLVVDDERTLRESCASVLQMDGYNVTLVGRGRRGARDGPPAQVRHHPRRPLHVADLGSRDPAGRARRLQGHHRRRHDRQSQRHEQHRGAPRRRVGLPAQALFAQRTFRS